MGTQDDHMNHDLASRLISAADGIVNRAASGLESDLRQAAEIVLETDRPVALIPRLMAEIDGIASRLERRTRRKPDADVQKAAALLRLMQKTLAADERRTRRAAAKLGRLH